MIKSVEIDFPQHVEQYVSLVQGSSVAEIIAIHNEDMLTFADSIPFDKANFAYAEDKWTIKEVLQHMIDSERIFAYRALAIARGENQILPGFDETIYAQNSNTAQRAFSDLKEEFYLVHTSNNLLFRSFTSQALSRKGTVSNNIYSCAGLIYTCFGHTLHHINIIDTKYLID